MPEVKQVLILALVMAYSMSASAQTSYSPAAKDTYADRVYWGDTHLHTHLSTDANAQGNKNLSPVDAYVVARGGTVDAHNGMKVRLFKPLDFLVIADHAENLGVANGVQTADQMLLDTRVGRRLIDQLAGVVVGPDTTPEALRDFIYSVGQEDNLVVDRRYRQSVWHRVTSTADQYNNPGTFTAFIGYEWTSNFEGGTRHRVVVFKDGADKADTILPFSARDSANPEDLWEFLDRYESSTGGEAFSISHNPNLSNGREFALDDGAGKPLSFEHQQMRARWEPLLEVTQIKGDSETIGYLSPNDEFADYETWEGWSVIRSEPGRSAGRPEVDPDKDPEQTKYEYARSGLMLGLRQQADIGTNPFKFGLIGSTDAHTGLPAVAENNFWGKHAIVEPSAERLSHIRYRWRMGASGYAAVWARENTRQALFDAMKRRETYATTGPRMTVRFFGGWDYETEDALRPNLTAIGYGKGVPMGGDLAAAPAGSVPSFLIRAIKDPDGANLDRLQVIKGWRDRAGNLHEKVFNVALSDGRKVRSNGSVEAVGSTVDVDSATYTNAIGDTELAIVWRDPGFDADELAFYYVRVLEIPTPRWPAYDAEFFGLRDIDEAVPMVTQERAYTSPIWYTP